MFVCYSAAFCQLCFYNKRLDWIGLFQKCISIFSIISLSVWEIYRRLNTKWTQDVLKFFLILCPKRGQVGFPNPRRNFHSPQNPTSQQKGTKIKVGRINLYMRSAVTRVTFTFHLLWSINNFSRYRRNLATETKMNADQLIRWIRCKSIVIETSYHNMLHPFLVGLLDVLVGFCEKTDLTWRESKVVVNASVCAGQAISRAIVHQRTVANCDSVNPLRLLRDSNRHL